jgi:hypothetical protein
MLETYLKACQIENYEEGVSSTIGDCCGAIDKILVPINGLSVGLYEICSLDPEFLSPLNYEFGFQPSRGKSRIPLKCYGTNVITFYPSE